MKCIYKDIVYPTVHRCLSRISIVTRIIFLVVSFTWPGDPGPLVPVRFPFLLPFGFLLRSFGCLSAPF